MLFLFYFLILQEDSACRYFSLIQWFVEDACQKTYEIFSDL